MHLFFLYASMVAELFFYLFNEKFSSSFKLVVVKWMVTRYAIIAMAATVVLHERGPLFRTLRPPKQQVSNIFKKFQSAGRSLLMMHENLHFSKQILHNFFQNFLFSIPWKIHEKPLSFCQPFYWPWIFNLHFSLEPGIVEACNMAHLNPVSLKINLVGWNPPFMPPILE